MITSSTGRAHSLHRLLRNVQPDGSGWSPLGSSPKRDVILSPGWRGGDDDDGGGGGGGRGGVPAGQPQHDLALILLRDKWISNKTGGWFEVGSDSGSSNGIGSSGSSGAGGGLLTVAGYSDNRLNGSMWTEECAAVRWGFGGGALLWHACDTRGGNSGSFLFVASSSTRQRLADSSSSSARSAHGASSKAAVLAMHVASQRVVRGSPLGVALEAELQAAGLPVVLADGDGDDDGGEQRLVVPLAVQFDGETLEWLRRTIAEHPCG